MKYTKFSSKQQKWILEPTIGIELEIQLIAWEESTTLCFEDWEVIHMYLCEITDERHHINYEQFRYRICGSCPKFKSIPKFIETGVVSDELQYLCNNCNRAFLNTRVQITGEELDAVVSQEVLEAIERLNELSIAYKSSTKITINPKDYGLFQ